MTIALDLIDQAEGLGVHFSAEAEKLKGRSTRPINDELLAKLREHKPDVIIELRQDKPHSRTEKQTFHSAGKESFPSARQTGSNSTQVRDDLDHSSEQALV